jgi:hypothetical protein
MAPEEPIKSDQKTFGAGPFDIWLSSCLSAVALFTGFGLLAFERQIDGPQYQS